MSKLKVFISSAIDELEYEREVATRTIENLNLEPSIFEGFPAMSKTLEDAYIDAVKKLRYICVNPLEKSSPGC